MSNPKSDQVESAEAAGAPLNEKPPVAEPIADLTAFKNELLTIVSDMVTDFEARLFAIERAINQLGASSPEAVEALADRLTKVEQRIKHFL